MPQETHTLVTFYDKAPRHQKEEELIDVLQTNDLLCFIQKGSVGSCIKRKEPLLNLSKNSGRFLGFCFEQSNSVLSSLLMNARTSFSTLRCACISVDDLALALSTGMHVFYVSKSKRFSTYITLTKPGGVSSSHTTAQPFRLHLSENHFFAYLLKVPSPHRNKRPRSLF